MLGSLWCFSRSSCLVAGQKWALLAKIPKTPWSAPLNCTLKLSHLKCSRGLLGEESSNPKICMNICNKQNWSSGSSHSCSMMLMSCRSPWTQSQVEWCQAAGKGTSGLQGNESTLEEVNLDICTQISAVLTAVLHYISVSCALGHLKIEAACVGDT